MKHSAKPRRWEAGPQLLGLLFAGALSACDAKVPVAASAAGPEANSTRQAPPGFLDPAPAPPESSTLILSGGTLLDPALAAEHPAGLFDAVVVVQHGKLLGFGKRGAVDVPDDSRGIDTSGQFLAATAGTRLTPGEPVTISVYPAPPAQGSAPIAVLANGIYQRLTNTSED